MIPTLPFDFSSNSSSLFGIFDFGFFVGCFSEFLVGGGWVMVGCDFSGYGGWISSVAGFSMVWVWWGVGLWLWRVVAMRERERVK